MVILPGRNGVIDTPGLVFYVTSGATISPATGIVTVKNGGEITLPDGSKRTVEPGTTINPITGAITPPRGDDENDGGGSGGCDTGLGAFALLGAAAVLRKRVRK